MMANDGRTPFSAADAALGYLYQVRCALLWALRGYKDEPDFVVGVETLDDVSFETLEGDPTELLQLKHHAPRTAGSLSDASEEIWRTLRIWSLGHTSGSIPDGARLFLISTRVAPSGSAAGYLRESGRDVDAARERLDATAHSSTSKDNKKSYEAYLGLVGSKRTAMLEKITVIDSAPSILDLEGELRKEVFWAVDSGHHEAFLDRLEGWWFRRVLRQLAQADTDRIAAVELEAQFSDLRDQFRLDALPVDQPAPATLGPRLQITRQLRKEKAASRCLIPHW